MNATTCPVSSGCGSLWMLFTKSWSRDGEVSYEISDPKQLSCAAAVARCLMPIRLRGPELRAIRRIAGWTAAELAERLREAVAPGTISRWENDKQPMGGYAEKVFRLVVCEALKDEAPGVDYRAQAIADMRVLDPWRIDPTFEVPAMVFERVKVRENRQILDTWELEELPMAA